MKEPHEDYAEYAARVNLKCEKFNIADCSADDLKVLVFVQGLNKLEESQTLEKLLNKMESQEMQREAAAGAAAREAIPKLKLEDAINFAMRLSSLRLEKSMVLNPETTKQSDVLAIHRRQHAKGIKQQANFNKPRANVESTTPAARGGEAAKARFPCWSCGEIHFARECPFLAEQCPTCKRTGHKEGYCEEGSAIRRPRSGRRSSKAVHTMSMSTRKFVEPEIGNIKLRYNCNSTPDPIGRSSQPLTGGSSDRPNCTTARNRL